MVESASGGFFGKKVKGTLGGGGGENKRVGVTSHPPEMAVGLPGGTVAMNTPEDMSINIAE